MKKPEIFKPDMSFIDNNEKAYYSFAGNYDIKDKENKEKTIKNNIKIKKDPIDFINRLSRGGYTFTKNVVIVTKDKTYETKIAGKLGEKIITMDNVSISIDDIIDIYEK